MNIPGTPEIQEPFFGNIESPSQYQILDSDDLFCSGWYYSVKGIKQIAVFLDGKKIGNAILGLERPDVKDAFPHSKNIEKSGFAYYGNIPLTDGKHTIRLEIIDQDNEKFVRPVEIIANKSICAVRWINVELTNHCNLSCRWCAGAGSRKKGFMGFTVFQNAIKQIISGRMQVKEIHLYNCGETLLHPEFCKFIEFIGKIPNRPTVILLTNATLLSEKMADCILQSRGIDVVQFSVDGGEKESFEWHRRGAQWEKTIENIRLFLEKNNHQLKTGLSTINMGKQFSEEFKEIVNRVDSFEYKSAVDWTGQEKLEDFHFVRKFNPHPCWHIQNNLVILWNGDITPCCADFHGRGVMGNIQHDQIYEVWKGKRLSLLRQQQSGKKSEMNLCKRCSLR